MLTYIMQFNMTICYIRGSSNMIPNSLSWLFQDSSPQECRVNEAKYMHDVDDFILPVTTRFQNRTSLDIDGWTTDTPRTKHAQLMQHQPSCSSHEETLHTSVRDDTKFPHAVQVPRGNRKTPPATGGMDSPCGMQHAHATPEVAVRDESKLVDAAQSNRGDAKTPLDTAIVDSPGPQQAHDTPHAAPASSGDAAAQRPDTPVCKLLIILIRRYAMMHLWIVIAQLIILIA